MASENWSDKSIARRGVVYVILHLKSR